MKSEEVWKWLAAAALAICMGVGVTAMVSSSSAADKAHEACAKAEQNRREKLAETASRDLFYSKSAGEVLENRLKNIEQAQADMRSDLKEILRRLPRVR